MILVFLVAYLLVGLVGFFAGWSLTRCRNIDVFSFFGALGGCLFLWPFLLALGVMVVMEDWGV